MTEYYETVHLEPGSEFETITAHDTLDEAIEFAEAHNIPTIYGYLDTFEKCWFCGEWYPICEMDNENTCKRCQMAIWSHEGGRR